MKNAIIGYVTALINGCHGPETKEMLTDLLDFIADFNCFPKSNMFYEITEENQMLRKRIHDLERLCEDNTETIKTLNNKLNKNI